MAYRICLIEGDGIGHEVIPAARRVLEATGLPLEFVEAEAGWETFEKRDLRPRGDGGEDPVLPRHPLRGRHQPHP